MGGKYEQRIQDSPAVEDEEYGQANSSVKGMSGITQMVSTQENIL